MQNQRDVPSIADHLTRQWRHDFWNDAQRTETKEGKRHTWTLSVPAKFSALPFLLYINHTQLIKSGFLLSLLECVWWVKTLRLPNFVHARVAHFSSVTYNESYYSRAQAPILRSPARTSKYWNVPQQPIVLDSMHKSAVSNSLALRWSGACERASPIVHLTTRETRKQTFLDFAHNSSGLNVALLYTKLEHPKQKNATLLWDRQTWQGEHGNSTVSQAVC